MSEAPNVHWKLTDLISPANIELHLKSSTTEGVLGELVAKIPEIAARPDTRQVLLRALLEREQLCSTGIGGGVALPHSRNALVGLVEKPVLVFGRHLQGIPYGSIDGEPAQLFFLLVASNVREHLQITARLNRVLIDAKLRHHLLRAESTDKALVLVREAEQKYLL
jgi:mannitol/fructose-specific phosphotransferase system IIA component (Ntr-type)